jgi:hypothetical protein
VVGNKISSCLAQKECSRFAASGVSANDKMKENAEEKM